MERFKKLAVFVAIFGAVTLNQPTANVFASVWDNRSPEVVRAEGIVLDTNLLKVKELSKKYEAYFNNIDKNPEMLAHLAKYKLMLTNIEQFIGNLKQNSPQNGLGATITTKSESMQKLDSLLRDLDAEHAAILHYLATQ